MYSLTQNFKCCHQVSPAKQVIHLIKNTFNYNISKIDCCVPGVSVICGSSTGNECYVFNSPQNVRSQFPVVVLLIIHTVLIYLGLLGLPYHQEQCNILGRGNVISEDMRLLYELVCQWKDPFQCSHFFQPLSHKVTVCRQTCIWPQNYKVVVILYVHNHMTNSSHYCFSNSVIMEQCP